MAQDGLCRVRINSEVDLPTGGVMGKEARANPRNRGEVGREVSITEIVLEDGMRTFGFNGDLGLLQEVITQTINDEESFAAVFGADAALQVEQGRGM